MAKKAKRKRKVTRLEKELFEQGRTIAWLNKATGLTRPTLSEMKAGSRSTFNESSLRLVGQALNVPHDELLTLVEV